MLHISGTYRIYCSRLLSPGSLSLSACSPYIVLVSILWFGHVSHWHLSVRRFSCATLMVSIIWPFLLVLVCPFSLFWSAFRAHSFIMYLPFSMSHAPSSHPLILPSHRTTTFPFTILVHSLYSCANTILLFLAHPIRCGVDHSHSAHASSG